MMETIDSIRVTFQALSGDSFILCVSRNVTAAELYAAASVAMMSSHLASSFLLSSDWVILPDDSKPFASMLDRTSVIVNVVQQHSQSGFRVLSFHELLEQRLWCQAASCFYASTCKKQLAMKRDKSGDSALAWVAYKAGNSSEALGLLRSIIGYSHTDARKTSPTTSTLPLHDAAWGNASPEAAVLVCAAFPGAASVRCGGQTPHELGVYHHGAAFKWPSVEELLDRAHLLRQTLRIGQPLVAVHRRHIQLTSTSSLDFTISHCLGLPRRVATVVTEFLVPVLNVQRVTSPSHKLQHAAAQQTEHQNNAVVAEHGMRRMQRPRVTGAVRCSQTRQLEAVDSHVLDINIQCDHLSEASRKERGRLAGARRMRGRRRCSFRETCDVQVGSGVVHRLFTHAVHSVRSDRHCPTSRWPSKVCLRRERAFQRSEKVRHCEWQ
jgi:hypothetical protein